MTCETEEFSVAGKMRACCTTESSSESPPRDSMDASWPCLEEEAISMPSGRQKGEYNARRSDGVVILFLWCGGRRLQFDGELIGPNGKHAK